MQYFVSFFQKNELIFSKIVNIIDVGVLHAYNDRYISFSRMRLPRGYAARNDG